MWWPTSTSTHTFPDVSRKFEMGINLYIYVRLNSCMVLIKLFFKCSYNEEYQNMFKGCSAQKINVLLKVFSHAYVAKTLTQLSGNHIWHVL